MRKNSFTPFLKNQRGQFLIEAVLLMVLSIGLLTFALKQLNDGKVLANLISGPWERAAGMIESGIWDKPEKAASHHPNQRSRSLSINPK
jgi:hypothetical protein